MALCTKIVDFIWFDGPNYIIQWARIGKIAIDKPKPNISTMGVLIDRIYPACIERTGPTNNAIDLIAFAQEQFREIWQILPGNAGD